MGGAKRRQDEGGNLPDSRSHSRCERELLLESPAPTAHDARLRSNGASNPAHTRRSVSEGCELFCRFRHGLLGLAAQEIAPASALGESRNYPREGERYGVCRNKSIRA